MSDSKFKGDYTKAFLSENPLDKDVAKTKFLGEEFVTKPNEAVYVYSFKEGKMLFAKGLEEFTGIKDEEVNIIQLNSFSDNSYSDFLNEFHDRVLFYLNHHNDNLESISIHVIREIPAHDFPIMSILKVFETDDNGNLVSILGKIIKDNSLKTSEVIQYAFSGIVDDKFEKEINHLDYELSISIKNISILELLDKGFSYEEIADDLGIPTMEITERLSELLTRFKLDSEEDLLKFGKKKLFIPNQFKNYLN